MKLRIFILVALCWLGTPLGAWSQATGAIEGRVRLPEGELAHRATVLLEELARVVETDELGHYRFDDVPEGSYSIRALQSFLDSETYSIDVQEGATVTLDIFLRISVVRQQVTVTATGREETTFDAVQSVVSLDSFQLSELMAPSLGEALDGQLGVSKRSFGAGNSRPVVRGFDGDRVLVMQDGMPIGSLGSQSGDHGEPIDISSVERLEVVKGPATLLYGSNAVGGVVNAVSSHQEFHQQPHEGLVGQVSSSVGSGNGQAGGSFNVDYGIGRWLFWTGGGGQRTGDYETPAGAIDNSKTRISNGALGLGWFGDRYFASIGYRGNDGRYGVPFATLFEAGEGGEEEVEEIDLAFRQHNFRFTGGIRELGSAIDSVQLSLTYSDWNHDEVEQFASGEQEVGTTFENQQFVYRGVFTQSPRGSLSGSFGVSGTVRNYETRGEEAIAPPVDETGFAFFGLEELNFDRVKLQIGGRLEHKKYEPGPGSGFSDVDFTGVSAGLGSRFDLWENGAFVASYTHSYRVPALEELYNFGPHVGNLTFEIGDPNLEPERSNGLDLSVRHQRDRIQAEANFFYYDSDNFVFLAPTGATQDGLIEAAYSQDDVRFLGTEMKLDYGITEDLWLNLSLDAVDTEIKTLASPLPRIPPMRGTIGLDIRRGGFSVKPELVLADARDDVFSTETSTAGYGLVNLKASYTVPTQHLSHHLGFEFFNIGDRLYRNHLSFIKDLAPEIGRGIRISYAVKFF